MQFIDPDGMSVHDFTINKNGKLKLEKVTMDNFDVVFNEEKYDAGKRDFDKSGNKSGIQIDKKEISNGITQTSEVTDDGMNTRTSFEVKTKDVADNLFKFLDKNTGVEYDNQNYTSPEGKSFNVITTSFKGGDYATISGVNSLTTWYLNKGNTLNSDIHNHPSDNYRGARVSDADRGYKEDIQGYKNVDEKYLGKNATFHMLWRGNVVDY